MGSAREAAIGTAGARNKNVIYKWLEVVNGRPVTRYSTKKPSGGSYEIVSR